MHYRQLHAEAARSHKVNIHTDTLNESGFVESKFRSDRVAIDADNS